MNAPILDPAAAIQTLLGKLDVMDKAAADAGRDSRNAVMGKNPALCSCGHAENCHGHTYLVPDTQPCLHGLPEWEWGGALLPEEIASGMCRYDGKPWQAPCECRDYKAT